MSIRDLSSLYPSTGMDLADLMRHAEDPRVAKLKERIRRAREELLLAIDEEELKATPFLKVIEALAVEP